MLYSQLLFIGDVLRPIFFNLKTSIHTVRVNSLIALNNLKTDAVLPAVRIRRKPFKSKLNINIMTDNMHNLTVNRMLLLNPR